MAAAGFSTCALYNDFTTPIPNTVGTGLPGILPPQDGSPTPDGNWLDCNGDASIDSTWYWQYWDGNLGLCSYVTQATDPVGGKLALLITIPQSAWGSSNGLDGWMLWTQAGAGQGINLPITTISHPQKWNFSDGSYFEATYRDDMPIADGGSDLQFWGPSAIDPSLAPCQDPTAYPIELDFLEFGYGDTGGSNGMLNTNGGAGCGYDGWAGAGALNNGNPIDMTSSYITVGYLVTNDGNSNYQVCAYLNGTRDNCFSIPAASGYDEERRFINFWWTGCHNGTSCPDDHVYIQDVKVYSCGTWLSSDPASWACSGTGNNGTIYTGAAGGSSSGDGVCGSANGETVSSAPTTNLCSAGTPSAVTADGSVAWIWTCNGGTGGTDAGCYATIGSSSGGGSPVSSSSSGGGSSSVSSSGAPSGSGTTGSSSGISSGGTTGSNGSSGSSGGGSSSGGSLPSGTDGVCGSANGQTLSSAPTTGLCSVGTPSPVTAEGSSAWIWNCDVGAGGNDAGCYATLGSSSGGSSSGGSASGGCGPIPAGAQALGFTTCALNMDFTGATTSQYNGNTFDAQDLSSWLDCKGASSPLFWAQDYLGPVNCNDFFITNDNGTNVLDLEFQPSDTGTSGRTIMSSCTQDLSTCGFTFPSNFYYDITMRVTSGTINACPSTGGGNCFYADDWSSVTNWSSNWEELDFIEMWTNGNIYTLYGATGSGAGGWGNNWPDAFGGGDPTSYHIYGVLSATDSSTATELCQYFDNTQNGCSGLTSGNFNTRLQLIDQTGTQNVPGICDSNGNCLPPTQNEDHYIQSIRVWSCSSWATGQCNVSPLPSPFP